MNKLCPQFLTLCALTLLIWGGACGAKVNAAEPANITKPFFSDVASLVYFTGIGCPHCASVDPILLKQRIRQGDLLVVEYEIYRDSANAPLMMVYHAQHETGLGVPMILATTKKDGSIAGDARILNSLDAFIEKNKGNNVILPTGSRPFLTLSLADLPQLPKIWFKNRVAVRKDKTTKESDAIKTFLLEGTSPADCLPTNETSVALSRNAVTFAKSCAFGGWLLMTD